MLRLHSWADGAYDRSAVIDDVLAGNPKASFIIPPIQGGCAWANCGQQPQPNETACSCNRRARANC
jgi:hypothetical protein